ncbi:NAD(P)H-dependent flavin oxidoreductase [Nioella aestuarii]|uniref:NAD(P)H-dependent flavin oxidoreductase n=1 Tax=Nioella aestuarii TaxID=1662864 RepID=UPI003D7FE433
MAWRDTPLTRLLNIDYPIIQAPMAGATTPAMAAAAANAGAMGSLGCAMMGIETMTAELRSAQAGTNRSLNVNFFVHDRPVPDEDLNAVVAARLAPWYYRLGAGVMQSPADTIPAFDELFCEAVITCRPTVASFHFGLPDAILVERLKAAGILILSSATSAAEARWLEDHGADIIVAQGAEAGGHNGWFLPRKGADLTGTMALVPRVVDAVSVPVVAAGGIADGRGVAAALMLGAAGVQVGTAFLATPECASPEVHKQAIVAATGDDTMATRAYSGRLARGVVNDFSRQMADHSDWPDFPLMNVATGPIRAASAKAGLPDAVALWSGQGAGLVRAETTAEVITRLVAETEAALARI